MRAKKKEQEEIDQLANQLESLQEDEDLLAGLEQLDQQEKQEIARRKTSSQMPTFEGSVEQGQGSAVDKENEEKKGNNSNFGLIGVVVAIGVAGAVYAYR
jgi:TolA-binding protein